MALIPASQAWVGKLIIDQSSTHRKSPLRKDSGGIALPHHGIRNCAYLGLSQLNILSSQNLRMRLSIMLPIVMNKAITLDLQFLKTTIL